MLLGTPAIYVLALKTLIVLYDLLRWIGSYLQLALSSPFRIFEDSCLIVCCSCYHLQLLLGGLTLRVCSEVIETRLVSFLLRTEETQVFSLAFYFNHRSPRLLSGLQKSICTQQSQQKQSQQ